MERDTAEVYYNKKEQAQAAANTANGMEIFGKIIKVTYYENNNEENKKIIEIKKFSDKREDIWQRVKLKNKNNLY